LLEAEPLRRAPAFSPLGLLADERRHMGENGDEEVDQAKDGHRREDHLKNPNRNRKKIDILKQSNKKFIFFQN